ncbi:hypothetical protein Hanom_Chr03g00266221 [Helianthus anomalus]
MISGSSIGSSVSTSEKLENTQSAAGPPHLKSNTTRKTLIYQSAYNHNCINISFKNRWLPIAPKGYDRAYDPIKLQVLFLPGYIDGYQDRCSMWKILNGFCDT